MNMVNSSLEQLLSILANGLQSVPCLCAVVAVLVCESEEYIAAPTGFLTVAVAF